MGVAQRQSPSWGCAGISQLGPGKSTTTRTGSNETTSDIILELAHASRLFFPQGQPSKRGASSVSRLSGAFADEPS
jgi:hypothetical protein